MASYALYVLYSATFEGQTISPHFCASPLHPPAPGVDSRMVGALGCCPEHLTPGPTSHAPGSEVQSSL